MNQIDEEARNLTYAEFPTKFVWHKDVKQWRRRKSGKCIGRIYNAHPTSGERFYLRLLLNVVRGPRSYEEIRTVNNVLYPTFKEACHALGLLDSDGEWNDALNEAANWASGFQLRELFVTLLLFCEVSEPHKLWENNWIIISEDIVHMQRRALQLPNLQLSEDQIRNHALL